jgi:hypothetical protein
MATLTNLRPRLAALDTRIAKHPPKTADPFYLSPEWRALMHAIISERGRRCQECGRTGCRLFGDHVVELKDGGAPLDPRNVLLRCGACHTRKTAAARAARMARPATKSRQDLR